MSVKHLICFLLLLFAVEFEVYAEKQIVYKEKHAQLLHKRAKRKYARGFYKEAYELSAHSLSILDSLKLTESELYADCKQQFGLSALMGNNDVDFFLNNISETAALKYKLHDKSEKYYTSLQVYADELLDYTFDIDFSKNIFLLEKVISIYESIPQCTFLKGYHTALNNYAVYYSKVDVTKSIELCHKLLDKEREVIKVKADRTIDTTLTYSNLAYFYHQAGYYEEALHYGKIVLDKREKKGTLDERRIANQRIASIHSSLDDVEKAIYYAKISLDLALEIYGDKSDEYARALQNISYYCLQNGDIESALYYARTAYEIPQIEKVGVIKNIATMYSWIEEFDSCYIYSKKLFEESKRQLVYELRNLPYKDRFSYACNTSTHEIINHPLLTTLYYNGNDSIKKLAYDCALFRKMVLNNCMKDRFGEDFINCDSVKALLADDEIAVEFWYDYGTELILALLLRNNWDAPKTVVLANVFKTINGEIATTNDYLPLYENIWKGIIDTAQIKEGERVYLSLDGALLEQIPVEAILGYDLKYMGDRYDVYRVSSTANIQAVRKKTEFSSIALFGGLNYDCSPTAVINETNSYATRSIGENLFAQMNDSAQKVIKSVSNFLPWTKIEVDSINDILSSSTQFDKINVYEGNQGVEESFKSLSEKSPDIIHIATHGVCVQPDRINAMSLNEIYDFYRENSALLMAGVLTTSQVNADSSRIDDGILRSIEISNLDLANTDLLVLSACKTGRGVGTPYGVVGLQWGFKAAGVETILMSLNDVDDVATHLMMTTFYKELAKGKTKREAFKKAQQKLRNSKEFNKFDYWAYFVLLD